MHEKAPKRGEFQSEKEYRIAYLQWLEVECPELASSIYGKLIKSALKNPSKWNSESACGKNE